MSDQNNIHHCLGEIRGQLLAIIQQNATIAESQKTTQEIVRNISNDVAAIKATQQHHGEQLSGLWKQVDKLEGRVDKQEVVVAKQATGIAIAASIGMAIIIESVKQWWIGK
jgi:hypothetical protein